MSLTAGFILEKGSGSLAQKSLQWEEWDCGQRTVSQGLEPRRMNQALFHHPFQNHSSAKTESALSGRNPIHPRNRVLYRWNEEEGKGSGRGEKGVHPYIQISFLPLPRIKEVFIRTLPCQPDKQAKVI